MRKQSWTAVSGSERKSCVVRSASSDVVIAFGSKGWHSNGTKPDCPARETHRLYRFTRILPLVTLRKSRQRQQVSVAAR